MNITVNLGERSYDILIEAGLLARLPRLLNERGLLAGRGLVVTDSNVGPLYGTGLADSLRSAGHEYPRSSVPSGEFSKSEACLFQLYDEALAAGLDRKSVIIALGGGVVGDLAGYAAASYMRGLRYIQVPTSLLAMVDSAVGGKTGINLPQGKNLIGAFHQPSLVLCDIGVLKTLPERELRAGMAEIIKYGIIIDEALFRYCEDNLDGALASDPEVIEHLVGRSCQIKAEVVRQDETESGLRAILNFGHTLGHAIEAVAGYGKYLHGEAISIGMVFAARLSAKVSGLPEADVGRIEQLLDRAGLPVRAPGLGWEELRSAMGSDKKSSSGQPRFVLADAIGKVRHGIEVDEETLSTTWISMG